MKKLKLTIDLLPKGAWGRNFSRTLTKSDWDSLRETAYEVAEHKCICCGLKSDDLEAHEVWDFDISSKIQTLVGIIALCPACHGVKHIRNSIKIGYGKQARSHFMKVNECDHNTFMCHFIEMEILFEERNKVEKWIIDAPLLDKLNIKYKRK